MSIPTAFAVDSHSAGQRLDQFLAANLDVSRARVQEIIASHNILVNDSPAKASLKLRGGERITILGQPERPPLRAIAEDIPLDIVYEDDDLAVINKPAGMMVHAGAGATEDARNRGTLVNALLHHFQTLSAVGGEMRPGIVHRLDKETSGLIVVAKNDNAHRQLAAQFARRETKKTYIALVHGWVKNDNATISNAISRDQFHRTRMTTRGSGGREAISHYRVVHRLQSGFGKFTLLEVKIDTGRTHQIRVHMHSLGHPIVGDVLYGAPRALPPSAKPASQKKVGARFRSEKGDNDDATDNAISLPRNFLHAAQLELAHPQTGKRIALQSPLPAELTAFLESIGGSSETFPRQLDAPEVNDRRRVGGYNRRAAGEPRG